MDLAGRSGMYCPIRRDLEERGWNLTSRLAAQTERLILIAGSDHHAFLQIREECQETAQEITESHVELREHRQEHGC